VKLTLTHEEAKIKHQDNFSGDFVITGMKRSGAWDFFPFSMVYGVSDIGSWEGNISTDGNNFVVTKSGYMDADKIVDTYKFSRDELETIEFGAIKTSFKFKNKFPPLTRRSGFMASLFLLSCLAIFPIIIYLFAFKNNTFVVRTDNTYNTEEAFLNLLKNNTESSKSGEEDKKETEKASA